MLLDKKRLFHIQKEIKIPIKFIKAEKAIAKGIKSGIIPKFYPKNGQMAPSNPFALARHATGFHGSTHINMRHSIKMHPVKMPHNSKLVLKGQSPYIHHIFEHLKKEHPSVRKRMHII